MGYQQSTQLLASLDGFNPKQGGVRRWRRLRPALTERVHHFRLPRNIRWVCSLRWERRRACWPVWAAGVCLRLPGAQDSPDAGDDFGFQRELPGKIALDTRFAGNYTSHLRAQDVATTGRLTYPELQYALTHGKFRLQQTGAESLLSVSFRNPCPAAAASPTIPRRWHCCCRFRSIAVSRRSCGRQYNVPIGKNWYNGLETKLTKRPPRFDIQRGVHLVEDHGWQWISERLSLSGRQRDALDFADMTARTCWR